MVDSFIKLYVKNPANQILLGKWQNEWELPGLPWDRGKSLRQELNAIAKEHGLKLSSFRLGALITRHWNTKPEPLLMHYYECRVECNDYHLPNDGTTQMAWFTPKDAQQAIPFEFMKLIMLGIDKHPEQTLAGAHCYYKDKNSSEILSKEITEPLYILS